MVEVCDKVLLIGNGINRVNNDSTDSWPELLEKLSVLAGAIDLKNPFKPLPLAFEELLALKNNSYVKAIRVLKEKAANIFSEVPSNELHNYIVNSNKYRNILITNYDYALENAKNRNFRHCLLNSISTNEQVHSLKRHYKIKDPDLSIWHIHGEIDDFKYKNAKIFYPSQSILIGYNQYVSYLNAIYAYFFISKNNNHTQCMSLQTKLRNCNNTPENVQIDTWIDFFFLKDIDIVGLSFDFSEMHLWWILNRRFSLKKNSDIFSRQADKEPYFIPQNTITYHYPQFIKRDSVNENCDGNMQTEKNEAILSMLSSLGVTLSPIKCNSYKQFYDKVLKSE
jgi:hypothetical protein